MDDRFSNLFWARTPGQTDVFPSDVTLVNVMPLLLNRYLGSSLPLHPDDLFFGPSDANHHYVPYRPATSDEPGRVAIGCACNQSEVSVLCSKACPSPQ